MEYLFHEAPWPVNLIAAKTRLSSGSITAAIDRRARIVHLCGDGCQAIACAFADREAAMGRALASLLRKLGLTVQW